MSKTREHLEKLEHYLTKEMVPHIENLLQEWQHTQVAGQERLNLIWNTFNVFLKLQLDKGVITQEEFYKTGKELADTAARNMAVAMKAAKAGHMPGAELVKTPLEQLQVILSNATQEVRKAIAAEEAEEDAEGQGTVVAGEKGESDE